MGERELQRRAAHKSRKTKPRKAHVEQMKKAQRARERTRTLRRRDVSMNPLLGLLLAEAAGQLLIGEPTRRALTDPDHAS